MRDARIKHGRVVHKSTAGILNSIPAAVDPVGNPPPALTGNTVALPPGKRIRVAVPLTGVGAFGAFRDMQTIDAVPYEELRTRALCGTWLTMGPQL